MCFLSMRKPVKCLTTWHKQKNLSSIDRAAGIWNKVIVPTSLLPNIY